MSTPIDPKTFPKDLKPPRSVPDRYLSGALFLCSRAVHEAQSNAMTITGAFNKMDLKLTVDGAWPPPIIPLPAGCVYARIFAEGPRSLEWTIFHRVLQFASLNQADAVMPIATGTVEMKPENNGMAEFSFNFIGSGFKLTPERLALVKEGVPFVVRTRYELWTGSEFVVAHAIDFTYTLGKQGSPDGTLAAESIQGA